MRSLIRSRNFLYSLVSFVAAWGVALYVLSSVSDFTKMAPAETSDYLAMMTGAEVIRNGDVKKLYDYNTQFFYQQRLMGNQVIPNLLAFRTPVTTAYIYSLLPSGNVGLSFGITAIANLLCIVLSLWFLTKKSLTKTFLMGTVCVFSAPVLLTIIGAQPVGPILLIVTLAFHFIYRDKPFVAGLLIACLFIKPNFLLATPFMFVLFKNRGQVFKYILGVVLMMSILIGVNSILYGHHFVEDYVTFLAHTEGEYSGTSISNNTNIIAVVHTFYSWLGMGYNKLVPVFITAITNLVIFYAIWRTRKQRTSEQTFAIICFVLPILNLHTMYPDLTLQLVPMTLLLPYYFKKRMWVSFILLLFLIVELPYYSIGNLEWAIALITLGATLWLLETIKKPAAIT